MKKLLLTLVGCLMCLMGYSQTLYLIGAGVTGNDGVSQSWDLQTNQMTNNGDNTWTWSGQELKNEFKINDGSWSGTYNIGSNGSNLTVGTAYNASNSGSSGNISFAGGITSVTNPTVTLKISGSTYQITVTGGEDSSVVISLAGSFNGNNANDTKYDLTEGSNQTFTGTFNFAAANPLKFQVIVNHSSWLGYNSSEGATVTFNGSNPVTKKLASGYENDFTVNNWPGGDITFTVDYAGQTVTMVANTNAEVVYPDKLYLIGQANGNDWNENEGVEQNGTDGVFQFKNITISDGGAGTGSFAFTTTLGSWSAINAGRYAPTEADKSISAGETQTMDPGQDRSWVIAAGTYDFTVDLPKLQLTVTAATTPEPELDNFYVRGSFNNWEDNEDYAIPNAGDGFFEGTLNIPAGDNVEFRIYGKQYYGAQADEANVDFAQNIYNTQEKELTIVKDGTTNWSLGNWPGGEVSFNLSLEDGTLTLEYTAPKPAYPDKLYLVGNTWAYNDKLLNSWDPENPIQFTSTQEGVFTLEGVELKNDGTSWFNFLNATGTWEVLKEAANPYRYGYVDNGEVYVGTNTQFQLLENLDDEYAFNIADGVYDFTVDFMNGYFKVTESTVEPFIPEITVPENLYIIGDLFENSWNTSSAPAFTNNQDGTFSMENVVFAPGENQEICYFTLSNIQADNWDDINAGTGLHRYGPLTDSQPVALDPETTALNYTTGYSWSINPGVYNFTVDFNNKVMTITEVIETMEIPDNLYFMGDVYAFNGQPVDAIDNWNPQAALEFTASEDEEGVFTLTGVELKADGNDQAWFNFINTKGTWDEIHALDNWCYGFVDDAEVQVDAATPFQLLETTETTGTFKIAAPAVYDFTVNFNTGEFTVTRSEVAPYEPAPFEPGDAISFIGSFDADQEGVWGQGITLEKNENGLYSGTFELKATESPIVFQINCGEGYIYGAAQGEDTVTLSDENPVALEMVYDATPWTLNNWEGGFITVTVDWETKTLTMVAETEETLSPEEFFVYVYNGVEWENVYLYIEDLEGYDIKPGVTTDVTKELYGNTFLVFSVETLNGAEESLLFSNGDDEELEPITYWFESDLYVELTPEGTVIIADPENFKPTSGVNSLYQYLDNETIYTLQGVKVDSNKLTKGIYIINGKKVMLK